MRVIFFSRTLFFVGLIVASNVTVGLSAGSAHAQACEDLFRTSVSDPSSGLMGLGRSLVERIVPSVGKRKAELAFEQSFAVSERAALHAVLVPDSRGIEVRRLETGTRSWVKDDPVFLFLYFEKMTPLARSALARILNSTMLNSKDPIGSAYHMIERIGAAPVTSESFVSVILETWAVSAKAHPQSFAEWSNEVREVFLRRKAEGAFESEAFKIQLSRAYDSTLAHQLWRRSVSLKDLGATVDRDGNLRIGDRRFGKIVSENANEVVIQVGREQIKRAAWNPLSHTEILNKIENGFRTVHMYQSFLGVDGYFYLLDGNHRFALDSRTKILLKLSSPISVSSLSNTMDAMGVPQPKSERLIGYHQGRLTLADLIGASYADQLVLLPALPPAR